jgi:hypothetical protein
MGERKKKKSVAGIDSKPVFRSLKASGLAIELPATY